MGPFPWRSGVAVSPTFRVLSTCAGPSALGSFLVEASGPMVAGAAVASGVGVGVREEWQRLHCAQMRQAG